MKGYGAGQGPVRLASSALYRVPGLAAFPQTRQAGTHIAREKIFVEQGQDARLTDGLAVVSTERFFDFALADGGTQRFRDNDAENESVVVL